MEINRNGGDLMHTNLTFWKLMICAEVLYHQGVDLYDMKFDGEDVPRLLLGAEWLHHGLLHPPYQMHSDGTCSPDVPLPSADVSLFQVGIVNPSHRYCPNIEMLYNAYRNRLNNKYNMPSTEQVMTEMKQNNLATVNTLTHADLFK